MHFLEWNCCILIQISLKFVAKDLIDDTHRIGPDYGLVQKKRQAIIWTNNGIVQINQINWYIIWVNEGLLYWRTYASLGLDELILSCIYSMASLRD